MGATTGRWMTQALVALALVGVASGCGGGTPPPGSPATPAPTATSADRSKAPPAASAPSGAPADGTDVSACRDGTCEVAVRAGTVIPLDPRFRVSTFRILAVSGRSVQISADSPSGGRSSTSGSVGGTGSINGLAYRILGVTGDTAVIALRPA